jgi:segregation and condensation protein B
LEKGLIRIMGRKDLPGKPLIYGTTKLFLETFDLKDISSLPKLKEIKKFGTEDYEPTPGMTDEEDEEHPREMTQETMTSTPDDDTMEVPFNPDIQDNEGSDNEKAPEEALHEEKTGDETRDIDDESAVSEEEENNQESSGQVDQSVSDSDEEYSQRSNNTTSES